MTEFPDEIEGDQRKLILDRCPLLRIFLDPYAQKDHDLWVDMLEKEMLLKRDEISEVVGAKKANKELNTLFKDFEEFEIFTYNLGRETRSSLVLTLMLIGYELTDIENAELFAGEVTNRLYEIGALNEEGVADPYDFIGEVLFCGMLMKDEVGDGEVREVWREFTRNLEF